MPNEQEKAPELSFGQRAAGVTFNPSKLEGVNKIKALAADLLDELDRQRSEVTDGEQKAQYTLAIRNVTQGKMWGVNAATWNL